MALWLPSLIIQDSLSAAALGQIPGRRTDTVSGHNPDIDAGPEDIWEGGGTWVAPTAPRNHAIASTNAIVPAGFTLAFRLLGDFSSLSQHEFLITGAFRN